jgi:hypothetical protein
MESSFAQNHHSMPGEKEEDLSTMCATPQVPGGSARKNTIVGSRIIDEAS